MGLFKFEMKCWQAKHDLYKARDSVKCDLGYAVHGVF